MAYLLESAIIIILQTREVRCNIGGISDSRERKRELTPAAHRPHRKMKCPVCGKYEFEEYDDYDICPVCNWENDGLQYNDHNYAGGAEFSPAACRF